MRLPTWSKYQTLHWQPHWKEIEIWKRHLRSREMELATIHRKRGGLYTYNNFIHTGPTNIRGSTRLSVIPTDDSLFQYIRRRECPKTAFFSELAERIKPVRPKDTK